VTSSAAQSARLNRLLRYLDHDTGNVALRKDAVREFEPALQDIERAGAGTSALGTSLPGLNSCEVTL
jgi:hypothetical protein